MDTRIFLFLGLLAASIPAQVGRGTLYQSLSQAQLSGVTSIVVTGSGRVTPGTVQAWSAGESAGDCRVALGRDELGLWLADRNGDGLPLDWPDVDALEVTAPVGGATQPSIYDHRFSLAADLVGTTGTLVTSGDIFRFSAIGALQIVIPRAQFQAALGTSQALNVSAYAELPGGAVLCSFAANGTGNNIVNPFTGSPGTSAFTPADVFLLRPPIGSLPAIFAYRQAELNTVVSFYYAGYNLTEVTGVAVQPGVTSINNPWDPTNLYQGGTRPRILWGVGGDDNVFCWDNALNPLSTAHNFYAIVGNGAASVAGYVTNGAANRVFANALAVADFNSGTASRLTLQVSNNNPTPGSNLTLSVQGPAPSGTRYQAVLTTTAASGPGIPLAVTGFDHLFLNPLDPLLQITFFPPVSSLFLTGPANNDGRAVTGSFPTPMIPGARFYFQAFQTSGSFPLSAPTFVFLQ